MHSTDRYSLHCGDCLTVMAGMPANSIDSVITDQPSGINFMGKSWDAHHTYEPRNEKARTLFDALVTIGVEPWEAGFAAFTADWAIEAQRVLKPGGMMLVWALPRTSDLTGLGLRVAGLEIRDNIYHLFGSGFPKSLAIDKAIDQHSGKKAERETVGHVTRVDGRIPANEKPQNLNGSIYETGIKDSSKRYITASATPEAQQWEGWGTALKPAVEEWILCMKPVEKTFAHNALTHGVAGLWIDGCRVPVDSNEPPRAAWGGTNSRNDGWGMTGYDPKHTTTQGRWPANLILDDEAAALLDELSGESTSKAAHRGAGINGATFKSPEYESTVRGHTDTGGASRFFTRIHYSPKASKRERNEGLPDGVENKHPTVKPLSLMRFLCRLTKTPTGGVVLDPFMGSGTTGVAALLEGREFIGIEMERESFETARHRIEHAAMQPVLLEAAD